jgi:hypothetical protein
MPAHQFMELTMINGPGTDHDKVGADVMGFNPLGKAIPLNGANNFRIAQDRTPQCLIGIGDIVKAFLDQIMRIVRRLCDFLQDDFTLPFDFVQRKSRFPHYIGEQVDGHRGLFAQQRQVVSRVITCCPGVHGGANPFGLKRDPARVTPAGSFERHVFHEVCETAEFDGFVAGTDPEPYADRCGAQAR